MHLDFLGRVGFFFFFLCLLGCSFQTSICFALFVQWRETLSILELQKKMKIKMLEAELIHHLAVVLQPTI